MSEETIFHLALQKPIAERDAFLEQACTGDLALRRLVEALLLAHDNPDSLLEPRVPGLAPTISEPIVAEHPGTVIGPYKLLEQIGEGGFGIVYMADQQAPVRRRVALKIIKPGMDTRQVLARFKAELQALALMDHPNIARVLDAGSTDSGRPYFVMELIRGVPITDYCDQNNLPVQERLNLFVQVCHAVQHAHQKGIIHRDIKPSNVLVTLNDGRPLPKVIDFGVAKALNQQLTQETLFTRFAEMIGTPLYMSPEQAEMTSLDIDTRADIYSLGVLLYELLTGSTPFHKDRLRKAAFDEIRRIIREEEPPKPSLRISSLGDTRITVAAHRHSDPHRLSQLLRGDLDWIVMKALEKDRTRRYDTASNFASDLLCYLSDRPVEACPPSSVYRFHKFARRNRVAITTATLVLISLLLGTVVSVIQAIRATRAEQLAEVRLQEETKARNDAELERLEADRQRSLADEQRKVAQAREFTARRYLYAAQMKLAEEAWERGHVRRVLELLNGQRPLPGQEDLRGFGWYYRWLLCHSDRMTLRTLYHVDSVAISPDGAVLASGDDSAAIKLWNVATGKEFAAFTGLNALGLTVMFSPDGRLLAAGLEDGTVRIWDMPSRQARAAFVGHAARICSIAFSSDGKTFATASADGTAKLWDISPRAEGSTRADAPAGSLLSTYSIPAPPTHRDPRATLEGHKKAVERIVFSPDGKIVATASGDRSIKLWDVVTGRERATLKGHNDTVSGLAFSPDGKLLASGSDDTTVRLWDPHSAQELAMLRGHADWVEYVAFSPDGSQLATASADDTVRLWDVGTRSERATFKGHTDKVWSLAFAPNGKTLVTGSHDGTVKVWDVVAGTQCVTLSGHRGRNFCVAFSADGKLLASGSDDATVRLWDVATRQQRATLLGHTKRIQTVAFAPDGKTLATGSWDCTLKLWDVASRQVRTTLSLHYYVYSVAFSPNGRILAAKCGDGLIKFWDTASGRQVRAIGGLGGGLQTSVAFSPNGGLLASASTDNTVKLWDSGTVRQQRSLGPHGALVNSVAFSPDGRTLASGCADNTVKLWDLTTGQERTTLRGHTAPVNAVTFSPDGRLLASASDDGTTMLWEAETGQDLVTLKGHTTNVKSIAFSPDGKALATASYDQTVKVWNLRAATQSEVLAHDRLVEPPRPKPTNEPNHLAQNNQAWALATDPDPNRRNPARAIELVTKALRQMPQRGVYWNTLGAALYRAGDWKSAQSALEQSMSLRAGGDAFDWYSLAMTQWQLGHKDEARKRYDKAVAWMDKNQPQNIELRRFRAEAAALLGVKEKKH